MNKNIRLFSILEKLVFKKRVCKKTLALEFGVSQKSINNDFEILEEYLDERLLKEKDCYTLLTKESFSKLFEKNLETTKAFLRLVSMVDSTLYNDFFQQNSSLLKSLNLIQSHIYQITDNPYEELHQENKKHLTTLEEAIVSKHYLSIYYTLPHKIQEVFSHSIPLKILYLGNNWYLALLTQNHLINNDGFRLLRINFISKVAFSKIEPLFFHNDNRDKLEAENFLKTIQNSFSKPNIKLYEVVLKIHKEKARYFKHKKYLTSQRVIKKFETGELLVSYKISNDMEIIPLIQKWIPYVEVIEPLNIKNKIAKNFEEFMKGV